jgi:cell division protein FtsI (penicillin-binding protein 3)
LKPFLDPALDQTPAAAAVEAGPARGRIRVAALAVAIVFCVLGARATQLAFAGAPEASPVAEAVATPARAIVEDRNGVLLIGAGEGRVLIARRELVWDAPATARALADVLPGLDAEALTARLTERERGVVYVRRGLTQAQAESALDLGLAGLDLEPEPRRLYPNGSLAGQTLGFTDIDLRPLAGVEAGLDRLITVQDRVRLSLDVRVQHALEAELSAGAEASGGQSGAGVVLDGRTGEVLALASWPFFDPNTPGEGSERARTHHAAAARYELGSSLKPLTFAMGLDAGVLEAGERLDTTRGVRVEDLFITDETPATSPISVEQALARSSNVAAVLTALRVGGPLQTGYLQRLGFDERFDFGLPEVAAHRLSPPTMAADVAARGYGYAVAVSPLALASAYTVFVNNGARVSLSLRPRDAAAATYSPVFSAQAAQAITAAMARALPEGTGRLAAHGVRLAGKTGTARRQNPDGTYDPDRVVASFAAVFPADAPRYVIVVVVDEPSGGAEEGASPTGGGVAAPIAARAAARIAPFVGLRVMAAQTVPDSGRTP